MHSRSPRFLRKGQDDGNAYLADYGRRYNESASILFVWDDDWSRGKCGFKAIQFMACGVPVVASAVGVNREIIQDGVNGFLAATEEEWVEKLGWLLSDPSLREKLGRAERETIVEQYSLAVHAPTMATVFRSALEAV